LVGVLLLLCAPALALRLLQAGTRVPGILKWVIVGIAGLGAVLAQTDMLGPDVSAQFWFGSLLVLCTPVLALDLERKKPSIRDFVRWGIIWCIAVGTVLVLTGAFKLDAPTTATCAILASSIVSIVGARKGWVPVSFGIPAWVRELLGGRAKRIKVALQSLTRFFSTALSSRATRITLCLVASVALVVIIFLLRYQIGSAFDVYVSLAKFIRQGAKENEDEVVFAALGLASVAVLSAVLITIVYQRYSRRLTAVVLAVAFLALVTLFCTYTAPEIVIQADRVVNPPTATPTPTETVAPTSTPVAPVIATPTEEVEESPTSAATEEPTDVMRTPAPKPSSTATLEPTPTATSPTPTRIQPSLTPTSTPDVTGPTPTRIQPTSVPPTPIPSPTRIQPTSPSPKPAATPTRNQP
jgi:hypothetical protein